MDDIIFGKLFLKRLSLVIFFVTNMLVGKATVAAPSDTQILGELESAVRRFGKGAHLSVLDIRSRQKVFSYRDSDQVKPASVLKLLTSSVALRRLGAHHQFETYFFTDQSGVKNGKIEHLYVKGGGDPSLTIEDLWIVVRSLRRRGVRRIGSIWLDDTYFEHIKPAVGQRAYETGTSALSFNHNSIEFEVCPSINGAPAAISYNPLEMGVRFQGKIQSVPRQGGYFSIDSISDGDQKGNGIAYQLSGSISSSSSCRSFYRSISKPVAYFGKTFVGLLVSEGIVVENGFESRAVPRSAREIYIQKSRPLTNILRDLNHFSTNFIAEQLVYFLGGDQLSGVLRRDDGLDSMGAFLKELGFASNEFKIIDGSGLSHSNRLTARMITALLLEMYHDPRYSSDFVSSLAIGGRSGTLMKRRFTLGGAMLRGKTGSLDGVSSLAGYVFSTSGRAFAFASISNKIGSKLEAEKFENEIVNILAEQ